MILQFCMVESVSAFNFIMKNESCTLHILTEKVMIGLP